MNTEQLAKVKDILAKHGLTERRMAKGMYSKEGGITADLTGKVPVIGMMINGKVQPEGNSNREIDEIQGEVEIFMIKSSSKSQSSVSEQAQKQPAGASVLAREETKLGAGDTSLKVGKMAGLGTQKQEELKKGTTTAICQACKCTITGTIDIFQKIQDEYGVIYCQKCSEDADEKHEQKEAAPKTSTPTPKIVKTCKSCGLELSGVRALECFQKDPQKPIMICEECEDNKLVDAVLEDGLKKRNGEGRKPDGRIPVQTYTQHGNIIKGFQPSLKEIGKIKIGGKGEERPKAGGGTFRIPVKFDHFEIVSLTRDEKGDLIKDPIMQVLGESPKELDIFLLFNDPTLNFVSRYNQYQGGKCLCQGDGEKATVSVPDKDGNKIIDCDPDTCPQFAKKLCKPNGILSVILAKSPRLGGVYKFRTTSFNSIRSILSSLFFLSNLTGGVLAMIPLKLTVSPMQVQPKDSAKPQTIFVVNIEFSGTAPELLQKTFDVQKYQSAMRENIIKLESTARAVLTAPESKEEIKEIEAEFYPKKNEVVA